MPGWGAQLPVQLPGTSACHYEGVCAHSRGSHSPPFAFWMVLPYCKLYAARVCSAGPPQTQVELPRGGPYPPSGGVPAAREGSVTSLISLILEPPLPIRDPHWLAGTTSLSVTGGLLVAGLLLIELMISWGGRKTHVWACCVHTSDCKCQAQ